MNTPLSWIKAYVPELEVTDKEYIDKMTLSGTKVEGLERLDADLDKIVVGQIVKIEKHPDADKLVVCQINIGEETIQIVTGATNVLEGQKVPVVLDGGRVASSHDGKKTQGGMKIKKGKLRGVLSQGMLCSIEELGQNREMYPNAPEDGIYILDEEVEIGADVIELLGLRESVFEYEVTSNRVDCFGVLGIAREVAATFNKQFKPPVVIAKGNGKDINGLIDVEVKDELCRRYVARIVKNVKIKPSPEWMQRRLAASGIRPINNIVDITNYVMQEYGQPMHAFDLSKIEDKKIIVRKANEDEEFVTLDGVTRKLDNNMLVICDGKKPVAIAGIMGGENSKITDQVQDIVFESACFDGTNIRLTSKRLGLRTDSSGKFEKGLDPNNAMVAINRACELIELLEAGEVVSGSIDEYKNINQPRRVEFSFEKANKLLGTDIKDEKMLDIFKKLELEYDERTKEVIVPTFRQDLETQADLAEEVARFFGYDNIPTTLPQGEATTGKLSLKLRIENIAKDVAEYNGFSQSMNYSFESPKVFDKLLLGSDSDKRKAVTIINPLGEDFSVMRTTPLNGILTSLSTNYNRRNKNVKLYELANIYVPKQIPVTELPDEKMQFVLGMYGEGDFFSMKAVVEELFEKLGINEKLIYNPDNKKEFLHPNRQADVIYKDIIVGYLGEVHPQVMDNYEIGEKTYIAVIDMNEIIPFATFERKYKGIAKYPAITRDLSMTMSKDIPVGKVEEVFDRCGGKLLQGYELFDIYEGSQIAKGFKSVAYSLVFRAADRTLLEEDISNSMDKILKELKVLGIELRG